MPEMNDPGLAAITEALQSLPLEDRVPGYGGAGIPVGDWLGIIDPDEEPEWDCEDSNAYQDRVEAGLEPEDDGTAPAAPGEEKR